MKTSMPCLSQLLRASVTQLSRPSADASRLLAGCRLRSWTRSCPTWTPLPFSPSVSPTSSSIGSPTRSECRGVRSVFLLWQKEMAIFSLPLSLQRSMGQDVRGRVLQGSKGKAEECGWAAAGCADGPSGGAGPATGILEDGVLQVRGCAWLKQVEKASSSNQQLHRTAQSNRARPTVRV